MKNIILTPDAPTPVGAYSQAVSVGNFVFCSGQIPIHPKTNEVLRGPIQDQAELVMKNIGAVLREAGLNYTNIVKTTIFLTDMNDFAPVNQVYSQYFSANPPARSTIAVKELPKGVQVEIEVLAHR